MEEDRSQDRNPHFVRACAVETHVKISQEEFLYGNSQPKCRSPKPRRRLVARLGSRNACQDFTRATLYINLQEKCRAPKPRRTLCASLRGRNALQHVKNHFLLKFTGKMPCTRLSPERGHTFCASLHNRNALQHFIRATLYINLQEKCRGPKPRLTLCASLRSRNACRMSRFHESNFIQKNAGKMRKTRVSTLIKHRPLHLP